MIMSLPVEQCKRENGANLAFSAQGIVPFLLPMQGFWSLPRSALYLSPGMLQRPLPASVTTLGWESLMRVGYDIVDFCPSCDISIPVLPPSWSIFRIYITLDCPRMIFRLCSPNYKTVIISVGLNVRGSLNHVEIKVATTSSSFISWQHFLAPRYEKIDFEQLDKSLVWVSKGVWSSKKSIDLGFEDSEIENLRIVEA
ncbi:hypothetical protein F5Y05DRAFT_108482 [Hypoxylon sp. FL0543]|nr:hypothetical protein F5Y05DRAFT_108482 [Hypoxylon sp. FL0543]